MTVGDGPGSAWTDVPPRDATPDRWIAWASRYNGYELLASHPAHLARVVAPAVEEYRATGVVPAWAGVHLLRGWLFLMVRADRHEGGRLFHDDELTATWRAVTDRLREMTDDPSDPFRPR